VNKADLVIDWATHAAATHACKKWHYSKSVPVPPLVKVGVWEKGKFIGVVIFSRGAARNLLNPYGLKQDEGCELTRIALNNHESQVSRIIMVAIKFLKKNSPKLRLIVSFADPQYGHHGGIYQASNWIFSGDTAKGREHYLNGKRLHDRQVSVTGYKKEFGEMRKVPKPSDCLVVKTDGKHRYLMPLDNDMKDKIKHLSKPYPKRVTKAISGDQSESGGAVPTSALQSG
jgi:hypothetical protein